LAGRVVPNWVGEKITVTKLAGREPTDSRRIRKLAKFVKVRKKMLLRDGFTCQICFGSGMDAHHIVTIREQPELAYELSNLVTVCKSCHDKKVSKREKEWEAYFKKVVGL
jgi:5-methylcytosine-specific restriction endonuclease McrA